MVGFTGAALMLPGLSVLGVDATPMVGPGFGSGFAGLALSVEVLTPTEAVLGSSVRPTRVGASSRPTRVGSAGAGAGAGAVGDFYGGEFCGEELLRAGRRQPAPR